MNTVKSSTIGAAVAAVLVVGAITAATAQPAPPAPAAAPAATPPAPPEAPSFSGPRHAGDYSSGTFDVTIYSPTCPAFVIGVDATAINEATSRSFVEAQEQIFRGERERFDSYEDCLLNNGSEDINTSGRVISESVSALSNGEANTFRALVDAVNANLPRVQALAAQPRPTERRRRGQDATPAAAPTVPTFVSTTVIPAAETRLVGTISGSASSPIYTSGCPTYSFPFTAADVNAVSSPAAFNAMGDALRVIGPQIASLIECRNFNMEADYDALQTRVNSGINTVFQPVRARFERDYAEINFQFNQQRLPGGLLAPPASRPAARPATPARPAARPAARRN